MFSTARIRIAQAPGGTGSLWVLMQLVNRARPGATIWASDPTWPNRNPIALNSGLAVKSYPYFDTKTRGVRFEQKLATPDGLSKDDVVLLHGCYHNPAGANLSNAQRDQVAASLARTSALPFIDLAYLGFGDGLATDAYGTRKVATSVPEALIAFSGSKNFSLCRERIGAAILVVRDADQAEVTQSQLFNIIRESYSQPPDHGAEIIRTILEDAALRAEREVELDMMSNCMIHLREKLSEAIRKKSNSADFDFIAAHRDMFSLFGLDNSVVEHLKAVSSIYMIGDSRINVAGIPEDRVGDLADAMLAAIK
ncbi:MAG: aminotransferase class I/II-fold pyridoxal phosphate-dependent enzyme [Candidatus Devosia euplotis]|nr:aminotransferase class I/II-fold pyridoxal phosphate-dependent enzyme [Candidatus Devosia euplotis]